MVSDTMQSLGQAVRALRRRPGFAGIAALTLALGIGANVAIFTVVESVLLRPLPYPGSDAIVVVGHHMPGLNLPDMNNSSGTIALYRESARKITRMAAVDESRRNLGGVERPDRVAVAAVTPEFFEVVATRPFLGRPIREEDVAEAAAPVAVLTYPAWQARFGGDAGVIGRMIEIDGQRTEIVGVMPRGFTYGDPDMVALLPLELDRVPQFGTFGIGGLARLKPGVTVEEAQAEATALQAEIPVRWPDVTQEFLDRGGWSVTVQRLRDSMVEDVKTALWILLGTVGLVLLVAGANVANLFLVRAESRQREVAVRSALGAGRRRIAGPFMAESLLLGGAGGVLGMVLAWAGVRLLVAFGPERLPRLHEVGFDGTVLLFGLALSVVAGLVLGVMPVLHLSGRSSTTLLRSGAQHATVGRERNRLRRALIIGQVATALVLLVSSGLMLRSMIRLRGVDPGFRPDGVLTVGVSLGRDDDASAVSFYEQVLDRLNGMPGIARVGLTNSLPIDLAGVNGSSFTIESKPRGDDELPPVAYFTAVTDGFFETMGIPLLAGRAPTRQDVRGGVPIVWVNREFQRAFLPDGALAERLRFGGEDSTWYEIAGVVGDVRTFGIREDVRPMAYFPMVGPTGMHIRMMYVVARGTSSAAALVPGIRATVRELDASVPVTAVRTMDEVVSASLAESSFTMTLLAVAALVALLLGVIGLYGVISYVVSQRVHEIGVRIALGAQPGAVRAMVVRQGAGVTLIGIALGLVAAIATTRLIASLLFGVSARDPVTFVATALVLGAVSLVATWLPARRAAAISPLEALREE
jgi:predicted permease